MNSSNFTVPPMRVVRKSFPPILINQCLKGSHPVHRQGNSPSVWLDLTSSRIRIDFSTGARHLIFLWISSSKLRSDRLGEKLSFSAFQRWFRIENRTIIRETIPVLVIYDSNGFLQTKGAPLLGEAPLIGRLRYVSYGAQKSS